MNETTGSAFSWSEVLNFMPAAPAGETLTVNHDNVLAAAKIIQTQIDALMDTVDAHKFALRIEQPANDPVSVDVALAWNDRLVDSEDSYVTRINEYLQSLMLLMTQLRDSAKTYGFNDQDIAGSFGATVA
ncbi:MAG: hypothetical protein ABW215_08595 [Kibdelosporangium sp.]